MHEDALALYSNQQPGLLCSFLTREPSSALPAHMHQQLLTSGLHFASGSSIWLSNAGMASAMASPPPHSLHMKERQLLAGWT